MGKYQPERKVSLQKYHFNILKKAKKYSRFPCRTFHIMLFIFSVQILQ